MQERAQTRQPGITVTGEGEQFAAKGVLDVHTLTAARGEMLPALKNGGTPALDIGGIDQLDTPGALFLCELRSKGVQLTGTRAEHQRLLDLISGLNLKQQPALYAPPRWRQLIVQLGKSAEAAARDAYDLVAFFGKVASAAGNALLHPGSTPLPSISRHVAETGINALFIVGVMGFMISIVIGYQGVAQLRPYGGEEFTINLVAVSVLREMGVLITSIMVAGRTGSAFTAEIGVMKVREEIDALKVMGLDPMYLLVLPRLVALLITLPLLAVYADMMGLLGGAAIAQVTLHLSPFQYLDRLHVAVTYKDFLVGLVKAPVFAVAIGVVGCMHGLRVSGSAESVGRETTSAVVKAIFLVLALDALFSILFEQLGV